jgi:HK97 gp10 family phage protein
MARSAVTNKTLGKVGSEVGIDGIPELKANIAAKLDKMMGQAAKKVFMRAAMRMVEEAKDLVPVKTGTLRDAIYAAYGDTKKPNVIVGVNYRKAPHAHLIEYGHIHTTHDGRGTSMTKAHPFMRPALTYARPKMAAIIAEGLKSLVQE